MDGARRVTTNEYSPSFGDAYGNAAKRPSAFTRMVDVVTPGTFTSIGADEPPLVVMSDDETNVERIDTIESSDRHLDPEQAAMSDAAKTRFRRAFASLPDREREVAVLLYVKNLTLREIGDILGVSESRICQIHSQLKKTLKQQLSEDSLLFTAVG